MIFVSQPTWRFLTPKKGRGLNKHLQLLIPFMILKIIS